MLKLKNCSKSMNDYELVVGRISQKAASRSEEF
jgi:hypothetical protein